MSRYYNIPNKVNLPMVPSSNNENENVFHCKSKNNFTIENEKKTSWLVKNRHPNISMAKENTPPRHAPVHHHSKLYKPWQTFVKASVSKSSHSNCLSTRKVERNFAGSDPRLIFNFIDTNKDSRLTYWEFRSWMLIIDRDLVEHEILTIFNEMDRNGDGFIQYKEFRDYFGDDLLTNDANVPELTKLFDEIDMNHQGHITVDQLLAFFNKNSQMVTEEEARVFLGMVSDIGNENRISLKEFLKAMQEWKI